MGRYFLDRNEYEELFPWTSDLSANYQVLRDEYTRVAQSRIRVWHDTHISKEGKWSACVLLHSGYKHKKNWAACPETVRYLEKIPGLITAGYFVLAPGGHLPAHNNYPRDIYRMHLGIMVPPACTFRVASEERDWADAEWLVFDPNHEHEAWNRSDQYRVILLLDVWRNPDRRPFKDRAFHTMDGFRFVMGQSRYGRPLVEFVGQSNAFRKVVRVLMKNDGEPEVQFEEPTVKVDAR